MSRLAELQCATCPCKFTWNLSIGKGQSCCIECKTGHPCTVPNPRPDKPVCDVCKTKGLIKCTAKCIANDCLKHNYDTEYPHDRFVNSGGMCSTIIEHKYGVITRYGTVVRYNYKDMSAMQLGASGVEIEYCSNEGQCRFCTKK